MRKGSATASASAPVPAAAFEKDDQKQILANSPKDTNLAFNNRHFVAGAIGGMTAAILTSPLEVVKTRLQVRSGRSLLGSSSSASLSTFKVMHSIVQTESVAGLWRGITPTLIGVIPARAIYFGAYNKFKSAFARRELEGRTFNFLAAAGAGSLSATLVCPIWVVKTRLQLMPAHPELVPATAAATKALSASQVTLGLAQSGSAGGGIRMPLHSKSKPKFSSIRQVAFEMYRKEGPRAFFRGLSASYWGISESAIQFALYEELKQQIEEPSHVKYFIAAGGSKLIAAALTYPHEVVRTRMRDQRAPVNSKLLKYRGMIQSIQTIFKEEGVRGLYGGMPAHLMRVVPNAAIMFLVVELITSEQESS